jgi:hypothetical protein
MWFAIAFIGFCVFLTVTVLKFESVSVEHHVKVEVKARKWLENLLRNRGKND